ncbi:MAG: hypothetical protein ABMA26_10140 [Limisphaerales bacterium]
MNTLRFLLSIVTRLSTLVGRGVLTAPLACPNNSAARWGQTRPTCHAFLAPLAVVLAMQLCPTGLSAAPADDAQRILAASGV